MLHPHWDPFISLHSPSSFLPLIPWPLYFVPALHIAISYLSLRPQLSCHSLRNLLWLLQALKDVSSSPPIPVVLYSIPCLSLICLLIYFHLSLVYWFTYFFFLFPPLNYNLWAGQAPYFLAWCHSVSVSIWTSTEQSSLNVWRMKKHTSDTVLNVGPTPYSCDLLSYDKWDPLCCFSKNLVIWVPLSIFTVVSVVYFYLL